MILETPRLYLREMDEGDAENAYLLNLDPDVVKYTGDVAFESVEEARAFLKSYSHYKDYGFGRWAVIKKDGNQFLGWCGLKYTLGLNEFDIGFRFMKAHWNKGYATEAAKACLKLGFEKFQIKEIVGRVMTENTGSIKVLEKIGLHYDKPYNFDGEEGFIYKLTNPILK